jgi:hypothetical protein
MKKVSLAAFLAAVVLGVGVPAFAQPAWNIHERMDQMERRIERGVENGSLNRHEARDLRGDLHRIKEREARMRADGHLDRRERERLDHDLDRLDRQISREKRDAR